MSSQERLKKSGGERKGKFYKQFNAENIINCVFICTDFGTQEMTSTV